MGLLVLLYELLFAAFGFAVLFSVFRGLISVYNQTLQSDFRMEPLPYIFGVYILGLIGAYFLVGTDDFVEPLNLLRIVFPLIFAVMIYVSYMIFSKPMFSLVVVACVAVTVFLQPLGDGTSFHPLPHWSVQILAIIFGSIFCLGAVILNFLPHTYILVQIITLFGLCMLGFIGGTPLYIALSAAILLGALSGYLFNNYYEIKINFDDISSIVTSYLVLNLLLMNLGEYSFPSCIIFTGIFWGELIMALYNRFFVSRSGTLQENTPYYLAAEQFNLYTLTTGIIRIGIISLFIGWFQLFSTNQYSLIVVAILFCIWFDSSLGHKIKGFGSLKEVNKEFISDLKQNIAETKKLLQKNKDK